MREFLQKLDDAAVAVGLGLVGGILLIIAALLERGL
jgi:hypothetical protein